MSELTFEEFREKLVRWAARMPQEAKKALTEAAETVRREVQAGHLTGPKMPRGVGHDTEATLAVRTGRLRRSIAIGVTVDKEKVSATVGTNVWYGRIHELGEGGMPERPFLRPSLAAKHSQIFTMLRTRLFESYNEGVV